MVWATVYLPAAIGGALNDRRLTGTAWNFCHHVVALVARKDVTPHGHRRAIGFIGHGYAATFTAAVSQFFFCSKTSAIVQ